MGIVEELVKIWPNEVCDTEDPESTKALIDTGNRREESMTSKEFKPLSVTVPRYSIVSLTDSRQLAPQGGR